MTEKDVLSEEEFNRYVGELERIHPSITTVHREDAARWLIAHNRALASQLKAERERREAAEALIVHSVEENGRHINCPACLYFAKYGDSC